MNILYLIKLALAIWVLNTLFMVFTGEKLICLENIMKFFGLLWDACVIAFRKIQGVFVEKKAEKEEKQQEEEASSTPQAAFDQTMVKAMAEDQERRKKENLPSRLEAQSQFIEGLYAAGIEGMIIPLDQNTVYDWVSRVSVVKDGRAEQGTVLFGADGLIQCVHLDNGKEFKIPEKEISEEALQRNIASAIQVPEFSSGVLDPAWTESIEKSGAGVYIDVRKLRKSGEMSEKELEIFANEVAAIDGFSRAKVANNKHGIVVYADLESAKPDPEPETMMGYSIPSVEEEEEEIRSIEAYDALVASMNGK